MTRQDELQAKLSTYFINRADVFLEDGYDACLIADSVVAAAASFVIYSMQSKGKITNTDIELAVRNFRRQLEERRNTLVLEGR